MMAAVWVHLIESTAFAIAVAALAFCMRRRSAAARYAVWLSGAVKFALPAALLAHLGNSLEGWLPAPYYSLVQRAGLSNRIDSLFSASESVSIDAPHHWFVPLLLIMWLSGLLAMAAVWIRRSFIDPCPRGEAAPAERELLATLQQRLGIRRAIRLQYSVPGKLELGLWGIRHPTIRVPPDLSSQLTQREFEAVLLHELAHVRRWDNLSGAIVHSLVCVFWFHPLLWWIERRLVVERERACDEWVLSTGAPAEIYLAGILKVCRFQLAEPVAGAAGMTRSDLQKRMEFIMSYRSRNLVIRMPRLLPATLAAVMTVVPFGGGFLRSAPPPTSGAGCFADGIKYPPGAVVRMALPGSGITKECAGGNWEPTNKAATVSVRPMLRSVCEIQPSTSPNACRCQDGDYSLGAIVATADGTRLRCDRFELGKFTMWRTATRHELGAK